MDFIYVKVIFQIDHAICSADNILRIFVIR